jgi:uncharacterized protein YxjI
MTTCTLAQMGNSFAVKEHVGLFKAASNYDIFDLRTGKLLLTCREPKLSKLTKILRFTKYGRMTPFALEVRTEASQLIIEVKRGAAFFRSRVTVSDGDGRLLGTFQQKLLSIGGKFDVLDANDQVACTLQGKWTGWDFRFVQGDTELARVTKKWSGIGKELLTTADNYVLDISPSVANNDSIRGLIIGAVLCIDKVLKE